MPPKAMPQIAALEDGVRRANQEFYAAFESLDLPRMEAVWAHDDSVECVQPGWDLLAGWEDVRERWARVFANTSRARVVLSGVRVRVEGSVGWIACTARVTMAFAEGFDEAVVQATNIFVLREGRWLLAVHHASVLPVVTESQPTVQ
jgi:ketosteroid isomerase-like protein